MAYVKSPSSSPREVLRELNADCDLLLVSSRLDSGKTNKLLSLNQQLFSLFKPVAKQATGFKITHTLHAGKHPRFYLPD